MLIKSLLFTATVLLPIILFSQNVAVNNDGSTAHPNAMLDIKGVNKGLLIPRGDAATRTALATNTAKGLMMYDTVTNAIWIHNGNGTAGGWNSLSNGTNLWQTAGALGTEIRNSNTGGFWSPSSAAVLVDPGVIQPPFSSAGTRLMWVPQKSAFRVGTVSSPLYWSADSIGTWSFAGGYNTRATGFKSLAFGEGTRAAGVNSSSFGFNTVATGFGSFAAGNGARAEGEASFAFGELSFATGEKSIVLGSSNRATGSAATAFGAFTLSAGNTSFASGVNTRATGDLSFTTGYGTVAQSFSSMAIGQFNDSVISSDKNLPISSDPLFYIGNGSSDLNRHNALVVYRNGNLLMKTPAAVTSNPTSFTVPISGSGTRMMWLPEKSAFRAGTVFETGVSLEDDSKNWNADSIGFHSIAMGFNAKATGEATVALGRYAYASNVYAVSIGNGNRADGFGASALGNSTIASGIYTTSFGNESEASGDYSIAGGFQSTASGFNSVAFGRRNFATGPYSITLGSFNLSAGDNSSSFGVNNEATGNLSMVMGLENVSKSYGSVSIGQFNDSITSSNKTSWVSTDPLLILGNGANSLSRSNAAVFYKNGNADINGYTQLGKTSEAAPAIKMKKLNTTTPAVQGGFTLIAHGIAPSKILSITALVTVPGGFQIMPNHIQAGFQYTLNVDNANIAVGTVAGSSGSILGMPVKILIVYEE